MQHQQQQCVNQCCQPPQSQPQSSCCGAIQQQQQQQCCGGQQQQVHFEPQWQQPHHLHHHHPQQPQQQHQQQQVHHRLRFQHDVSRSCDDKQRGKNFLSASHVGGCNTRRAPGRERSWIPKNVKNIKSLRVPAAMLPPTFFCRDPPF